MPLDVMRDVSGFASANESAGKALLAFQNQEEEFQKASKSVDEFRKFFMESE